MNRNDPDLNRRLYSVEAIAHSYVGSHQIFRELARAAIEAMRELLQPEPVAWRWQVSRHLALRRRLAGEWSRTTLSGMCAQ